MEIYEAKRIIEEVVGRPLPEIFEVLEALWREAYETGYEGGYADAQEHVGEWHKPYGY